MSDAAQPGETNPQRPERKLAFGYEYQGEQSVKNIAEPVRAYKGQLEAEETLQPEFLAGRITAAPGLQRPCCHTACHSCPAQSRLGVGEAPTDARCHDVQKRRPISAQLLCVRIINGQAS